MRGGLIVVTIVPNELRSGAWRMVLYGTTRPCPASANAIWWYHDASIERTEDNKQEPGRGILTMDRICSKFRFPDKANQPCMVEPVASSHRPYQYICQEFICVLSSAHVDFFKKFVFHSPGRFFFPLKK